MKNKMNFKKVIAVLFIALAIIVLCVVGYIFLKLTTLNSSINDPLGRKQSELRNKPLENYSRDSKMITPYFFSFKSKAQ